LPGAEAGVAGETAAVVEPQRELVHQAAVGFGSGEAQREQHQIGGDHLFGAWLWPPLPGFCPGQVQRLDVAVGVAFEAEGGGGEHPHVPVGPGPRDATAVPALAGRSGQLHQPAGAVAGLERRRGARRQATDHLQNRLRPIGHVPVGEHLGFGVDDRHLRALAVHVDPDVNRHHQASFPSSY
jgi:hypothetical protein